MFIAFNKIQLFAIIAKNDLILIYCQWYRLLRNAG